MCGTVYLNIRIKLFHTSHDSSCYVCLTLSDIHIELCNAYWVAIIHSPSLMSTPSWSPKRSTLYTTWLVELASLFCCTDQEELWLSATLFTVRTRAVLNSWDVSTNSMNEQLMKAINRLSDQDKSALAVNSRVETSEISSDIRPFRAHTVVVPPSKDLNRPPLLVTAPQSWCWARSPVVLAPDQLFSKSDKRTFLCSLSFTGDHFASSLNTIQQSLVLGVWVQLGVCQVLQGSRVWVVCASVG